jgi:hypothetical protein
MYMNVCTCRSFAEVSFLYHELAPVRGKHIHFKRRVMKTDVWKEITSTIFFSLFDQIEEIGLDSQFFSSVYPSYVQPSLQVRADCPPNPLVRTTALSAQNVRLSPLFVDQHFRPFITSVRSSHLSIYRFCLSFYHRCLPNTLVRPTAMSAEQLCPPKTCVRLYHLCLSTNTFVRSSLCSSNTLVHLSSLFALQTLFPSITAVFPTPLSSQQHCPPNTFVHLSSLFILPTHFSF